MARLRYSVNARIFAVAAAPSIVSGHSFLLRMISRHSLSDFDSYGRWRCFFLWMFNRFLRNTALTASSHAFTMRMTAVSLRYSMRGLLKSSIAASIAEREFSISLIYETYGWRLRDKVSLSGN